MFMRKISIGFFLLGSLIALFNGPFEALGGVEPFMYGLLVFCGLFIGYFNITKEQENKFFTATLVFIAAALVFRNILFGGLGSLGVEQAEALEPLRQVIFNFIIFISSAGIVVATRAVVNLASEGEYHDGFEASLKQKDIEEKSHEAWDVAILFSVAAMFVIFVLRQMFVVEEYAQILDVADFMIWTIFVVDLMFIYERYRDLGAFFKNAWLDIIAVVPFGLMASGLGQVGRLAKLGRLIKILRVFGEAGKTSKVAKFAHLNKITKYFSDDSSFNKYLQSPNKSKKATKKTKKKKN